jgi:F-type H+-transporting ATPase subunit a
MSSEGSRSLDQLDIQHHLDAQNSLSFFGYDVPLPRFHIGNLDLSITNHVLMMMLAAGLCAAIFIPMARRWSSVPKGLQAFFEPVIVFVRDGIVMPHLGDHLGAAYLPFFLTAFFFIFFMNLLGLVPFGASATGNIFVTGALAAITLVTIILTGMRQQGPIAFWKNLVPPGLPLALWPLMFAIEVVGLLAKPFALMVRLWANMTGGHIVLGVVVGFIFLFKNLPVAGISVLASVALSILELFVAVLQAYIFTFLSALFIGASSHAEH